MVNYSTVVLGTYLVGRPFIPYLLRRGAVSQSAARRRVCCVPARRNNRLFLNFAINVFLVALSSPAEDDEAAGARGCETGDPLETNAVL